MATVNTGIGSSLMKFTFTDEDGEVVASFRMNPADIKLAQRCKDVSAFFDKLRDEAPESASLEDVVKWNGQVEEKVCYLLGYDARDSLFGLISATSVMADGNMFVVHVVNKITETVGPEIRKRKQAMDKAIAKHTAKYKK